MNFLLNFNFNKVYRIKNLKKAKKRYQSLMLNKNKIKISPSFRNEYKYLKKISSKFKLNMKYGFIFRRINFFKKSNYYIRFFQILMNIIK